MAQVILLNIQKNILSSSAEKSVKDIAKFYEVFDDKILALLVQSSLTDQELYNIMEDNTLEMGISTLNNFARNRLINNFEEEHPELTLTIMGCSENSTLVKVRRLDVDRRTGYKKIIQPSG